MALRQQVAAYLAAAGITADDPALEQIRQWNRDARARAELESAGLRKRAFGYQVDTRGYGPPRRPADPSDGPIRPYLPGPTSG